MSRFVKIRAQLGGATIGETIFTRLYRKTILKILIHVLREFVFKGEWDHPMTQGTRMYMV
jgi:hypothetical protein